MAKKIDDGKSQIILIAAVVVITMFMLFGMFNRNGKRVENNDKKNNAEIFKNKKTKERKVANPEISDGYQVLKVSDGDTISIQKVDNGKFVGEILKIRMYGMDAPEKSQDYGPESRQALEKLVAGKTLSIEIKNKDRYSRTVAIVYANGKNVNEEMVKTGNAWWYQEYAKKDTQFEEYQKNAMKKKLGLFSRKGYIEPWVYRKNKKENNSLAKTRTKTKIKRK